MSEMHYFVYVLRYRSLADVVPNDFKYYVNRTSDLNGRLFYNFTGKAEIWTDTHILDKVIHVHLERSTNDESNLVREYMKLFGIDNVRGGPYNLIKLSTEVKCVLQQEINYAFSTDEASRCLFRTDSVTSKSPGGSGHSPQSSNSTARLIQQSPSVPSSATGAIGQQHLPYPPVPADLSNRSTNSLPRTPVRMDAENHVFRQANNTSSNIGSIINSASFHTVLAAEGFPAPVATTVYGAAVLPYASSIPVAVPVTGAGAGAAAGAAGAGEQTRINVVQPAQSNFPSASPTNVAGAVIYPPSGVLHGSGGIPTPVSPRKRPSSEIVKTCERCGFDSHHVGICHARIHKQLKPDQLSHPTAKCMHCGSDSHYTKFCRDL